MTHIKRFILFMVKLLKILWRISWHSWLTSYLTWSWYKDFPVSKKLLDLSSVLSRFWISFVFSSRTHLVLKTILLVSSNVLTTLWNTLLLTGFKSWCLWGLNIISLESLYPRLGKYDSSLRMYFLIPQAWFFTNIGHLIWLTSKFNWEAIYGSSSWIYLWRAIAEALSKIHSLFIK